MYGVRFIYTLRCIICDMIVDKNETSDENILRLNILIHKKSLQTLDSIREKGYFGSRGKTIEALIDIMPELQKDLVEIQKLSKIPDFMNNQDSAFRYVLATTDILRKLSRFTEIDKIKT